MIRTSSLRSSSDTYPIAPWQAICPFLLRAANGTRRRSALVWRIEHNSRTRWVISDGGRGFSPSGTFEQDDMDNWQECAQTGASSLGLCQ